ncbi:hypothetical protein [Sphingomonas sp. C3-2]|uniref:hypothetical protein n=1 Tax=Sphingomonas sp. C3-2 TaxID=3062169 RepID=UPI00294B88D9|nr:hypothetical protein [Sphingomonas sp. C3-2]WOK37242.1 hypothetical protein QYC26_03370 [Sphingomonas sp. C3-2]
MQRRITNLTLKIGLPVLTGQFLFDWLSSDLWSATDHLPERAILIFAVLLLWAVFRERRDRKNQTFC